jgi:uncharacterized membrane protein
MKYQIVVTGIYFAIWAAVLTGVVYAVTNAGYSIWLGVALAYLLFLFLNGSLAYAFLVKKLRQEGKQPPSYVMYVIFPKGYPGHVAVARPIRVILGVVIMLGGTLMVFAGVTIPISDFKRMPHPVEATLMLVGLGAAFIYTGYRLTVMSDNDSLFRRSKAPKS